MSLAVVHLNGNLGHHAELRYTTTGTPVLNFSVACSSYFSWTSSALVVSYLIILPLALLCGLVLSVFMVGWSFLRR